MKKTVAIIGSHPATRDDFDWNRTDADIWGFNEALVADWFKRADGIFQMHKPVIWRSKTNRNDPNHYEWLKSGNTPVIYMQDEYADVPKSEEYPLDEILNLTPGIGYFTSSVAYALALAIYKGYERIEVYGVEMETESEYGHQRVGVAFWCGVALGKGIEVEFHSPSFFNAPLYGYAGDVEIPLEHYQNRIETMQKHLEGANDMFGKVKMRIDGMLEGWIKTLKTDISELDTLVVALGQNGHSFGLADGIIQTNQAYLDKCNKMIEEGGSYLIVRQEFEGNGAGAVKEFHKANDIVKKIGMKLEEVRKTFDEGTNRAKRAEIVAEFKKGLKAFTDATTNLGRFNGLVQENRRILNKYDQMLRDAGVDKEQAAEIQQEVEAA